MKSVSFALRSLFIHRHARLMKIRDTFSKYGYSLVGAVLVTMILAVLGFALVSSLRHLLWVYMMNGHPAPSNWLWASFIFIAAITIVVWYRVLEATLIHRQQRRQFLFRIQPLLKPFPHGLQKELLKRADWYLIDTQDPFAFTWGFKKAQIAISQGLWDSLDESAQKAVLYHELAHVLHHDPLQQSFLQVLSKALRPIGIGSLYDRYLVRREILADSFAISACKGNEVPLLTAMLAVAGNAKFEEARADLAGAMDARISFMETGLFPGWWDQPIRFRLLSTVFAIALTIGEGMLVWCH